MEGDGSDRGRIFSGAGISGGRRFPYSRRVSLQTEGTIIYHQTSRSERFPSLNHEQKWHVWLLKKRYIIATLVLYVGSLLIMPFNLADLTCWEDTNVNTEENHEPKNGAHRDEGTDYRKFLNTPKKCDKAQSCQVDATYPQSHLPLRSEQDT
ncbi:hypothetical protein HZ326_16523 [Fusarium oxysporum f. sp. albedinis]|nr:hypothetical protein HZ326_16523 [Fusarium oxysporum f. sp. albedinis]